MRVVVRNSSIFNQSQSLLALAGTSRYTADEVERILLPHFRKDGSCTSLSLDYEGEYIPICNREELRLVARLVSVAHNAYVDPKYGKNASNDNIEELEMESRKRNVGHGDNIENDDVFYDAQDCFYKLPHDLQYHMTWRKSCSDFRHKNKSHKKVWDEEKDGEQKVYDADFEMNAEISDKMMQNNVQDMDEKYGMYV